MSKIKNIVFIGAAGVGKTTLMEELAKKYEGKYSFINEIVRELCKEKGYKSVYEIEDSKAFRFEILDKQIEEETRCLKEKKVFISDRSTIDCWAYFMRWSLLDVTVEEAESYYQKAREHAKNYDQIIFIPKMFDTPDDNFRWANDTYQEQIERLMNMVLFEWGLLEKTYFIKSLDTQDRLAELENLLEL